MSVEKTLEQRRQEKREYDKIYRAKNKEMLKAKKADYFKKTYDPLKASLTRKTAEYREKHRKYCQNEKYKTGYKKDYDRKYRAKRKYSEGDEAFLILLELEKEIRKRASAYEIRLKNGHYKRASQAQRDRKKYGKIECGIFKN